MRIVALLALVAVLVWLSFVGMASPRRTLRVQTRPQVGHRRNYRAPSVLKESPGFPRRGFFPH